MKGDTDAAIDFLEMYCWRRGRAATLTAIMPDGPGIETRWFGDPSGCAAWIDGCQGRRNLYFSVNRTRPGIRRKAGREAITHVDSLHLDLDDPSDAALARLRDFRSPPAIVIFSGGGYNALWPIKSPSTDLPAMESLNRALQAAFSADHCWDACRILRIPGSINVPGRKKRERGRKPALAKLVSFSDVLVTPSEVIEPLPEHELIAPAATVRLPSNLPEVDLEALPLDDRWKMILLRGYDPGEPDRHLKPDGGVDRSRWVYAATCVMIRAGMPDELIASALLDADLGIGQHVREQPRPRAYAARQIANARRKSDG